MLQKARAYPHLGKMPFLLAAAATEKEHNAGGKNNESTWFNKGLAWWVGANATQTKTP